MGVKSLKGTKRLTFSQPVPSFSKQRRDFGAALLTCHKEASTEGINVKLNLLWVFKGFALICSADSTYMLTGWTEPFSVGDDHERRPQAGCVVPVVTRIAQQNLERR